MSGQDQVQLVHLLKRAIGLASTMKVAARAIRVEDSRLGTRAFDGPFEHHAIVYFSVLVGVHHCRDAGSMSVCCS